jgi:predicted AlkP superfamily pyrophosphatase or phosphodiesterase
MKINMNIKNTLLVSLVCASGFVAMVEAHTTREPNDKPKLVVGIIVDQMRTEYLYRYYHQFSDGGFKRLMLQGFQVKNMHYNYVPTYTAPGHASVFTGTTPAYHGIIGNDWFSYEDMERIYCAADGSVETVGSTSEKGHHSPHRLLSTTLADELRIFSSFRSKSVGISVKDRGAIFPVGKTANGAYWFDTETGNFVTSNYYMNDLPQWLKDFNQQGNAEKYLSQNWEPLLPIDQYLESTADDVPHEHLIENQTSSTFPYELSSIREDDSYSLIPETPFGNTLVADLAVDAINGEALGQDEFTDFLSVSFSSTDYIGHTKGTHSIEIQDTYLRLDRDIARLITHLDEVVGEGEYLLFLTADHAGAPTPGYFAGKKVSTGGSPVKDWWKQLNEYLNNEYGTADWLLHAVNQQVYFNRELIEKNEKDIKRMRRDVADYLIEIDLITHVYTYDDLVINDYSSGPGSFVDLGFHANRSGDVAYVMKPGYVSGEHYGNFGTTHGSSYTYDTHVPSLWYGWQIKPGETIERYNIVDIAATVSMMLNIPLPNSCVGNPIEELFDD